MKLLKEIIELHNHVFEWQMLASELSTSVPCYVFLKYISCMSE